MKQALKAYSAQVALLPGAREVLELCEQRGLPLALVSNGPDDMQRAAVQALGLEHFFRSILVSGDRDVGVRKPNARIFGLACTGLETLPERVLMVGDDLEADVRGALAYGMQAVYLGGANVRDEGLEAVPDLSALHRWLEARLINA